MQTKKEFLKRLHQLSYTQKTFSEYIGRSEDALKRWDDNNIPLWAWKIIELLEVDYEYKKFIESQKFINSIMNKYTSKG